MRILSVGSLGKDGRISPFRWDQGEALKKVGVDVDYFNVREGGFRGYIKAYFALKRFLKSRKYHIIHAHYGLSGMISVLQRKIPVVITFHGSDIWQRKNRFISRIASYLSAANIFISEALRKRAKGFRKKHSFIIPCGVDLQTFFPMDKNKVRDTLGWSHDKKYILFTSSFDNPVKNYPLAKKVVEQLPGSELVELHGYTREEVNLLMNACDVLLVTSFFESGPLVVKEAMACNLPIVSTDVGDVKEVIKDTKNCFIVEKEIKKITEKVKIIFRNIYEINGFEKMKKFNTNSTANRIYSLYRKFI